MSLLRIVLNLLRKIGHTAVKEVAEGDTDSGLPMTSDTDIVPKKRGERLRLKPFSPPKKFECNVPAYILEKKDVQPHERYMLESQSIIAQKVDFAMESLAEMNECMREQERELIAFRRWKSKFSRRVALLILLLIAFFSYLAPYFQTNKTGHATQQTNAPVRIP